MSFQTRDLWMVSLGVVGDVPVSPLQEQLPDGMHLRWAFNPAKGFPWYGYHLFRRPSWRDWERLCLSRYLRGYRAGAVLGTSVTLGPGTLASDQSLRLTDDFPGPAVPEIDLDGRDHVTYDLLAGDPAYWVQATIGFRRGDQGERVCVDYGRERPGPVDNPLEREQARFTSHDHRGVPFPEGQVTRVGGLIGWDVGFSADIELPCTAGWVEVVLVSGASPARVEALDAAGNIVDAVGMSGGGPQMLTLRGSGIIVVRVVAPQDETVLVRVCWICGDDGREEIEIPLRGLFGGVTMTDAVATGRPGDVVTVDLNADALDGVWIGAGPAALIDLCFSLVGWGAGGGWKELEGFPYPLCLPVAHPDYPCPNAPGSYADAENTAMGRIVYGSAGPWARAPFKALHDRLEALVRGGPPPVGEAMNVRGEPFAATPADGGLSHRRQRPLDLVLLGALHPPIAQQTGLYWWDKSAVPGEHYDYLLVADHDGSLGGSAVKALSWVNNVWDFTVNDGFVAFNRVVAPAAPLAPPMDVRCFALPGATLAPRASATVLDATNNTGLCWDQKLAGNVLLPGSPVLYHVWRADLGNVETPGAPADTDFSAVTKAAPIPVGATIVQPPQTPPQPEQWPPFPLQYIDRALPEGWYAYRVNGVDLFGRHSTPSASAQWRQWTPRPDPRPWYYVDPPSGAILDPGRIRLLDKLPPPAPPGVEAYALDPDDPTVTRDPAWQAWQTSLSPAERRTVIGVRVRWHWDVEQQRQAPDTREFRIYYNSGPLNTVRGRVTGVIAVGTNQSDVRTDAPNTAAANAYVGLWARIGARSFRIVASDAGAPLRFRVQHLGPADDIRPEPRTRCAIAAPPGHALAADFGDAAAWRQRLVTISYDEHVQVSGGRRRYEVFLPLAGGANRTGLPLFTTLEEPVAAGVIGVTAADGRPHTPDHRGDSARFGNESRTGGPATVLRVRRERPPTPPVPPDGPKVWATKADYHGRSYYTCRWTPSAHLRTLVYRALDDAVFQADLAARPRPPLSPDDLAAFPAEPRWDALKRQQVAAELNALNGLGPEAARAAYRTLSNDGLRVLAGLPGIERVFLQLSTQPLDPAELDPAAPDGLRWRRAGPDVASGTLASGERAYVDTLDGKAANRFFYRTAYVDEVHNVGLLGLSGPPVWLPDVVAPTTPRMARVVAGERRITLTWSSNREPDLAAYRIYRTDDERAARDLRLMTLVHTLPVPPGDPAARPHLVTWQDDPVPGLRDLWYRLVAVDRADPDPGGGGGNVSEPTPVIRTRAYDQIPPEPPALTSLAWVRLDPGGTAHPWHTPAGPGWSAGVRATWPAAEPGTRLLLQVRGEYDEGFGVPGAWLEPGTTETVHRTDRTAESLTYRLKAVSDAGNVNVLWRPKTLPPPV